MDRDKYKRGGKKMGEEGGGKMMTEEAKERNQEIQVGEIFNSTCLLYNYIFRNVCI